MEGLSLLANMALVLGIALLAGLVASYLKLPVIIGYLVIGVVIGPNVLGFVEDAKDVETVATIGVVLLMFTLGVEFSLKTLRNVGRIAIIGGVLQVVITIVLGFAIARIVGYSNQESLLFGFFISASSTTIVLKLLRDRGELGTCHGRIMTGILLIQDISVVPMMAIIPAFGGSGSDLAIDIGWALLKATLFLGGTILLGLWGFPRFMKIIAGERSRELFLISIVSICLLAGFLAEYFGLSIALGAFLAGLMVSESDYAHQAMADTMPLRDIFAVLFFVSLGMLADPSFVAENPGLMVIVIVAIVAGKTILTAVITRFFGYGTKTTLFVGTGLFNFGEFSFILAALAYDEGLIDKDLYALTLTAAFITILLTPFSMGFVSRLYYYLIKSERLKPQLTKGDDDTKNIRGTAYRLSSHVVICGYGRVARNLLSVLDSNTIPYLIVDMDPEIISRARKKGIPYIFGDASRPEVLAATNLEKSGVMVVALPDPLATRLVVRNARRINPKLHIIARVHWDNEVEILEKLGVNEIVRPENEAGVEIIRLTLRRFGMHPVETERVLSEFKEGKN